ncbi:leucine-rich repeat receptor-like protein kinase TDR [Argentina anserina]|uniref:leucine-rich repeat receptor-like protein kinase TDR n=1 Tax=Argentina anserina TaxID=57926 RepID=UPI0021768070|nr:leucine-rich repeat receptor-like protein kinase TDR [Potentilla anserina]
MEVPHSFFSLHSNLLVLFMFFAAVSAADPYSQTLMSLKSELTDDYDTLKDWSLPHGENPSPKIYACSWSGVKCNSNNSSVTGLDLSMKRLSGSISSERVNFSVFTDLLDLNLSYNSFSGKLPVAMFTLANLTSLDISRNNFSGQFPAGVSGLKSLVLFDAFSNSFSGSLPAELSQLQKLKVLNLAGSYFKGPIPLEYGNFQSLEFIHLAGNMLSGNIPPELGKLRTVTHMEIGYNSYQGGIPWQLGNMSQLQYLDIAYASLSESIPRELGNLTKLESLFLFRNQLTGSIPVEFSKLQSLTSLDLSDNLISGPIPDSLLELKNLKLLSLFYNEMSGVVPEGVAELPSLETLLLWNNFFSGNLPENLGRNSNLMWVDVSTNYFNGSIPADICVKGVLFKLMMFSNNFSSSLAPSLSNCSSLVRLRLEDNSFSGEIPLKFSNFHDLSYVDLSKNKFTGGIPIDIDHAPKLEYFNVSNNPELGGTIPAVTWSLPLLRNFSASSCSILGNLPPFGSCKSISVIELNMNSLSGAIPDSVSSCRALERIGLANNNLSGHIPEDLASLPALRVLDLSHNGFDGPIPSKFGSSSSLSLLNVSFNDISGTIPSGKVARTMGSSAFVGNPKLCGEPLRSCPGSVAIFGSRTTVKLIWILLLCAGIVMFLTLSVLGILYYQQGSKGQWKMVSFAGLPQFTAKDVLKSFSSIDSMDDALPPMSASVCKAVLPTGITVSVKKYEWDPKMAKVMLPFITQLGNARHKNLIRLLGFCYNKHLVYLLYDYLPNGSLSEKIRVKREWAAKYKIVVSIARGLCFLHHECHPAIAHGDLRSSNIVFDENMEPHLTEFGFKHLRELNKTSDTTETSTTDTSATTSTIGEDLYRDVYSFGEIMLEILTNGNLTNSGASLHNQTREIILRDIINENEVGSNNSAQEGIKKVLEIATLCTRSRPSDQPSMEHTLKLLQAH